MATERVQRHIERLLDEADEAIRAKDWGLVREQAQAVLDLDPKNADAGGFLQAAERALSRERAGSAGAEAAPSGEAVTPTPAQPHSFCDDRYRVVRFLGEGGKKRVYLAHDTKLDRDVAFALIRSEGLDQPSRQRIQREAQAMGRLGAHPHIVSVFDLGEEHEQPYIITELMGGGDVEGLIEKADEHRLPLERVLEIGQQVCQGLGFAHEKGIIHRDLKPGNVWLTADGTAKLGDFGLAVALDRSRLTQAGMMVGTVAYMPPEQAMGGEVTPRSDLYALGAMLYEMVTGRPPFVGDESVAIISQHLNTPPVSPTWHRPDLPRSLEAIILRLLEKDPTKRPGSADEVGQALAAITEGTAPSISPASLALPQVHDPLYGHIFVGREQELQHLQSAFDAALSGRGSVAMVVGEPGIGKTALCEQLATYAALRGGRALIGHCYEEGSLTLPYLPFVEAMRSYVLTREPEDLRADLGSGAADLARIVSEIRERVEVESLPPGDPEDDRWRLFQAVTAFLRAAAGVQALLLVLEDLHWADRGTLDYLVYLARNLSGARLLIVGSYRDVDVDRAHPLSGALAELRRVGELSRVSLRGLTPDEVHRMINGLAGQGVRWSLAEAVHRQTEGNPLFIQEVLRFLVEEGLITHEDGRWRRSGEEAPELHIPEGLRDVIGKRLSRLGAECNRLLSIASVMGREFDLLALKHVAALDEEVLLSSLEEALRGGVLEEHSRLGTVRYRFAHALFQQTLYDEIIAARRIQLHQQVGAAIEALFAPRLEDHAAELAEHFSHSSDPGDLARAVEYGERAANRATAVFAYAEAARHLERCLQVQDVLAPDDKAKRCDLLLALGEVILPSEDPQRVATMVAPDAFAAAEAIGDSVRAARAAVLALEALGRATSPGGGAANWELAESHEWLARADRYAEVGTPDRVYVDIRLGMALMATSGPLAAHPVLRRAVEHARLLEDDPAFVMAAAHGLRFLLALRDRDTTDLLTDDFLRRPHQGARSGDLGLCLTFAGEGLLERGDRDGAERVWEELRELAQRTHDTSLAVLAMSVAIEKSPLMANKSPR